MKQQNPDIGGSKSNNTWPVLLAVIITAAVVGGGMYWWQSTKIPAEPVATEVSEAESAQLMEAEDVSVPTKLVDTAISGTTIEQNYKFSRGEQESFNSISGNGLVYIGRKEIAKLYANEEDITSFYAPEHPTDENIIFFSTNNYAFNESLDQKSTSKIYSYNIKTDEITKIYEEHESRLLRTMGMDGSKLVLMFDGFDNSPGLCFSIWAKWSEFGYLELSDISSDLRPYNVPSYQVEIGKAEEEECVKQFLE